jgi:hypothetical protein
MAVLSMSKQEFNRLDVLLRVLHFQPGAFKWGQTDERPSFPVGGYLNPNCAVAHGCAHPEVSRLTAVSSGRPIRATDSQLALAVGLFDTGLDPGIA